MIAGAMAIRGLRRQMPSAESPSCTNPAATSRPPTGRRRARPVSIGTVSDQVRTAEDADQKRASGVEGCSVSAKFGFKSPWAEKADATSIPTPFSASSPNQTTGPILRRVCTGTT